MPSPSAPTRKSIFESPWYWVYLFATGALIALMLMSWKFGPRQAQLENKYLGHEAAAEKAAGRQPERRQLSTPDRTIIDLAPLYLLLAAVFAVAWIAVWRQLFRRPPAESPGDASGEANETAGGASAGEPASAAPGKVFASGGETAEQGASGDKTTEHEAVERAVSGSPESTTSK